MLRTFCRCKIHRVTITDANLNYVGSLTVDTDLMAAAGLLPYEQVHVVNINNGARLETYVIPGAAGSGTIALNGAAARLGAPGDIAIVIAYTQLEPGDLAEFRPTFVHVDTANGITRIERPADVVDWLAAEPAGEPS